MRRDVERVQDVLEALDRVEKYSGRGRAEFEADELIQTWITHHLQIVGEASRGLSDEFQAEHPEIPWTQITGLLSILGGDRG